MEAEVRVSSSAGGASSRSPRRARERRLEPALRCRRGRLPSRFAAPAPATRQVTNFLTPDAFDGADKLICCRAADTRRQLVLATRRTSTTTPRAARSTTRRSTTSASVAPARADYAPEGYARPPHLHATTARSTPPSTVRDGDVFLVPRGYHGPCVAAPGYPLYYLNVMAGPGPEPDDGVRRRPAARLDPRHVGDDGARSALPDDPAAGTTA